MAAHDTSPRTVGLRRVALRRRDRRPRQFLACLGSFGDDFFGDDADDD